MCRCGRSSPNGPRRPDEIVNGEQLIGPPVTLELVDVPEGRALESLLRSASGYIAKPRAGRSGGTRVDDRLHDDHADEPGADAATSAADAVHQSAQPVVMPNIVDDRRGSASPMHAARAVPQGAADAAEPSAGQPPMQPGQQPRADRRRCRGRACCRSRRRTSRRQPVASFRTAVRPPGLPGVRGCRGGGQNAWRRRRGRASVRRRPSRRRIIAIMSASPPVVRRGEYAARGDYHRDARSRPGTTTRPTSRSSPPSALARSRCRRRRACSTPAAAKACSSTSMPDRLAIEGRRSELLVGPRARRIAHGAALSRRVVRSRVVPRRARAPDVRGAAARARGAAPRAAAGRRAARVGAQPRAPAVARALPAAAAGSSARRPSSSIRAIVRSASTSSWRGAPGFDARRAARASFRPCRC